MWASRLFTSNGNKLNEQSNLKIILFAFVFIGNWELLKLNEIKYSKDKKTKKKFHFNRK